MRFTEKNKILLVHRSMQPYTSDKTVDIILTPQFYLVKKEAIPVRTRYRAKKIAPSLFEGLLEPSMAYDYFVYQEGEQWVFIVYSIDEIKAFLDTKGLGAEKVGKVYFAEQVKSSLSRPVRLSENETMTVLDETVVVVPGQVPEDAGEGTHFLPARPKHAVTIEGDTKMILEKEQAYILTAIFILFALIWFTEGWRYKKNDRFVQAQQEELYADFPSLQSRYTRESILEKYTHIDEVERKKRRLVAQISDMIFKGVTVNLFELDSKGYKVVFSVSDKGVYTKLDKLLQSKGFAKSPSSSFPNIVIEGKL